MKVISYMLIVAVLISCGKSTHESSIDSAATDVDSTTSLIDNEIASGDSSAKTPDDASPDEETDCIFDETTQTDEFLKDDAELENYTWNNDSKIATVILSNGDTLYVQRGGCYHFAYGGRLVTRDNHDVMDSTYWLKKGEWIASKVFRQVDEQLLNDIISNHEYEIINDDDERLLFHFLGDHTYADFTQLVMRKGEWVETELSFYID